tara:strand:- start:1124 stop:1300 length:177 start_codon:yes stop_codon:yes gene_type:complete
LNLIFEPNIPKTTDLVISPVPIKPKIILKKYIHPNKKKDQQKLAGLFNNLYLSVIRMI